MMFHLFQLSLCVCTSFVSWNILCIWICKRIEKEKKQWGTAKPCHNYLILPLSILFDPWCWCSSHESLTPHVALNLHYSPVCIDLINMLDLSERRSSGSIFTYKRIWNFPKPQDWKFQDSILSRNFDFFINLLFAHGASYFDFVPSGTKCSKV